MSQSLRIHGYMAFDLEIPKFQEFQIFVTYMANAYYTTQTVKSPQDAKKFKNEYTWKILEILHEAGSRGLTEVEVRKKVERKMHTTASRSRIYDLLDELYEDEWIHRFYDSKVGAKRVAIAFNWAEIGLSGKYDKKIVDLEGEYIKRKLFPIYLEFIKQTMEDLKGDPSGSGWLPDPKNSCSFCAAKEGRGTNHEAHEFVASLLDISTAEFMESDEFLGLLKEYKLIKEESEEED
jgi:hypothetical protein